MGEKTTTQKSTKRGPLKWWKMQFNWRVFSFSPSLSLCRAALESLHVFCSSPTRRRGILDAVLQQDIASVLYVRARDPIIDSEDDCRLRTVHALTVAAVQPQSIKGSLVAQRSDAVLLFFFLPFLLIFSILLFLTLLGFLFIDGACVCVCVSTCVFG